MGARLEPGGMRASNYMLDAFVAPKLSEFTSPALPDLDNDFGPWLPRFILMSLFHVKLEAYDRRLMLNYLRSVESAGAEYDLGRSAVTKYLNTSRNTFSPYFEALFHLEVSIAQADLALVLLGKLKDVEKWFEKGDGSYVERLRGIHNSIKHADERLLAPALPPAHTTAVWMTNNGLESLEHQFAFEELAELLDFLGRQADEVLNIPQQLAERLASEQSNLPSASSTSDEAPPP